MVENAMTKTVGPPERPREPEQVGAGTITRALNITSERQAERIVTPGFLQIRLYEDRSSGVAAVQLGS